MDMRLDNAIIRPNQQTPAYDLGPFAVMAAVSPDLNALCKALYQGRCEARSLAMSRLYPKDSSENVSLVGPMMGAPYAAYLLESLIAWGAKQILFWGWCGAVSPHVHIGDIILPDCAFIDEGTSRHYQDKPADTATASKDMTCRLQEMLRAQGLSFHQGPIWSTDGIFRETPEKVLHFREKGALAVEMEASALFTVGRFRKVAVGAILIVSDELSDLSWQPGFKDRRFRDTRQAICKGLAKLCRTL